jgi:hypothetical protein
MDQKQLETFIMQYLLEQKLLGRDEIYESEIFEAIGFPWDNEEDQLIQLTDLGEQEVSRRIQIS